MKASVYVAAPLHHLAEARAVADLLAPYVTIVSSWHVGSPTIDGEAQLSNAEMSAIGDTCIAEIRSASALVLLYGDETMRHGHVGEAFYAMGRGKSVVTCPVVEGAELPTRLLLASGVSHVAYVPALVRLVKDGWPG